MYSNWYTLYMINKKGGYNEYRGSSIYNDWQLSGWYMEAIKSYEPSQDSIRLREVKKWLKMMKIDLKRFNILVQKDIIKPFRKGQGKNSPLYFSKTEIKQALSVANVSGILARDKVKSVINDNVVLRCS